MLIMLQKISAPIFIVLDMLISRHVRIVSDVQVSAWRVKAWHIFQTRTN